MRNAAASVPRASPSSLRSAAPERRQRTTSSLSPFAERIEEQLQQRPRHENCDEQDASSPGQEIGAESQTRGQSVASTPGGIRGVPQREHDEHQRRRAQQHFSAVMVGVTQEGALQKLPGHDGDHQGRPKSRASREQLPTENVDGHDRQRPQDRRHVSADDVDEAGRWRAGPEHKSGRRDNPVQHWSGVDPSPPGCTRYGSCQSAMGSPVRVRRPTACGTTASFSANET